MIDRLKIGTGALAAIIVVSLFGLTGCDNPTQSTGNGDGNSNYSAIEGRVVQGEVGQDKALGKAPSGIEGAAVIVARLEADGSLEDVARDTVYTDASGHYQVQTTVENESNLVVVARKNGKMWKSTVTMDLEHKTVAYAPPASDESTVETEVYTEIRMREGTELVTFADVQAKITAGLATDLQHNSQDVGQIASAIASETRAQANIMTEKYDVTESEFGAYLEAKTDAQNRLVTALNEAGTDESQVRAAYETFMENYTTLHSEAGLEIRRYARTSQIAGSAGLRFLVTVDDSVRFQLIRRGAFLRTIIVDQAVQARFKSSGASDSVMTAAVDAGVELRSEVRASTSVDQIFSAYASYRSSIVELLKATLDTRAELITQLNSSFNSDGGAKAVLRSKLSTALSNSVIIDAYFQFFNTVKERVESTFQAAGESEITSTIQILILVNMAG